MEMQASAAALVGNWSGLVGHVLGDLDLDELAIATRALRRRRGAPNARALLRWCWGAGSARGPSLRETAVGRIWPQVAGTDAAGQGARVPNGARLAPMSSKSDATKVVAQLDSRGISDQG
jgi:hypothetical protein